MQSITIDLSPTGRATRYYRVGRIAAHTLLGLCIASIVLPLSGKPTRTRLIQWWCKKLLAAFNLRISSHGHVPAPDIQLTSAMFVANHISWSDIHAINSMISLRFIAKSEIRNWPIFGYLVSRANTLFIDRSKKSDAKRTLDIAVQSLQAGDNLCLFPEGTTTDGTALHPFKSSLIQAAIEAQASIHPIAIRYPHPNGGINVDAAYAGETTLMQSMQKILAQASIHPIAIRYPHPNGGINVDAAYAGETTLMQSMQKILAQRQPVIELHFLEPITAEEVTKRNRRELTLHIENLIRQHLSR